MGSTAGGTDTASGSADQDSADQDSADQDSAAKLSLRGVGLSYRTARGRMMALRDVSLDLASGEFVALVGPSGCGKSTLLQLVAGLQRPTRGTIRLDGQELAGEVPPGVGLVFQSDALLPWRTVADNIRFPLAIKGVSAARQRERVAELVELVGLGSFSDHYPSQLSGGMRKRVGIARAIAYDPDVYLMDEPFGPLDAQMRLRLGAEFLSIWEQLGTSVIFVTHDVEEAVAMADRVLVMSAGPGTIKEEFPVTLPRPRHFHEVRYEPEFQRLQRAIWGSLADELERPHT